MARFAAQAVVVLCSPQLLLPRLHDYSPRQSERAKRLIRVACRRKQPDAATEKLYYIIGQRGGSRVLTGRHVMQRGKCYTVWVPPCSLKSPGSSYHSFVISGATCAENRRGEREKKAWSHFARASSLFRFRPDDAGRKETKRDHGHLVSAPEEICSNIRPDVPVGCLVEWVEMVLKLFFRASGPSYTASDDATLQSSYTRSPCNR